ncbi:hybrid sensor histidine kinase/response regulator [Arcticibacter sp. MXS-1]|uniref:hybrid sensor histidine kinase/response regulator n=1 Tax=Arcticibacter sp. MXS-1 TaxID=3341726 RepID=UPI0035A8307C
MSEKLKILYVDDEPNNLISFKALLRLDFKIFTAQTSSEAEKHLMDHPDIRVIFCDQRMPDKTGVEFFDEIRVKYPLPVRVLITGYADIEAVIDAINKSHIFRYLKKPWVHEDLLSAITEANNFYIANSMLGVKNKELQKAYEELDKFAYSVSHDIRGPLSGLLGAISLSHEMSGLSEIKDMLNLMEKSVKKLDVFVQGMHEYYSLQRGELLIKEIDLNKIVDDTRDIYKLYARANQINFDIDVHLTEPFRNDEILLKIVINNLLSNAFKYQRAESDTHYVQLRIDVNKGKTTIVVSDNGIGIPEKYQGDIFNLFFRASTKGAGSGFGLYNVKDALVKLNGEITVESIVDVGTTFTVTIPNK